MKRNRRIVGVARTVTAEMAKLYEGNQRAFVCKSIDSDMFWSSQSSVDYITLGRQERFKPTNGQRCCVSCLSSRPLDSFSSLYAANAITPKKEAINPICERCQEFILKSFRLPTPPDLDTFLSHYANYKVLGDTTNLKKFVEKLTSRAGLQISNDTLIQRRSGVVIEAAPLCFHHGTRHWIRNLNRYDVPRNQWGLLYAIFGLNAKNASKKRRVLFVQAFHPDDHKKHKQKYNAEYHRNWYKNWKERTAKNEYGKLLRTKHANRCKQFMKDYNNRDEVKAKRREAWLKEWEAIKRDPVAHEQYKQERRIKYAARKERREAK